MGWKKWLFIAVVVIGLYLYFRPALNLRSGISFVGLSPLLGSLKESRKYFDNFMGGIVEDKPLKKREAAEPVAAVTPTATKPYGKITIPDKWDFTDIRGDKKNERVTRRVLETLYCLPFPTIRPSWLLNPRTGRRLEIDCLNEEVGIACEYSGRQHFEQCDRFHRSREEFVSQVYRDKVKKEIILDRGLDFIVVPYTIATHDIPFYIQQMLRRLGRLE